MTLPVCSVLGLLVLAALAGQAHTNAAGDVADAVAPKELVQLGVLSGCVEVRSNALDASAQYDAICDAIASRSRTHPDWNRKDARTLALGNRLEGGSVLAHGQ